MIEKRAAFLTLGCKVNQYETDAMEELLKENGYEIVDFSEDADVYIINTCSVTNMADRKSRQMISKAKKKNPNAVIVAAGCYVQASEEKLKEAHSADILIGNNCKKDIAIVLEEYFKKNEKKPGCELEEEPDKESISRVIDIAKDHEYESLTVHDVRDHTRAYLKVQDGCNQFCSYCIIPYTRGRIRSKNPDEVMAEVVSLAKQGFKEIVLTGIHLGSYGKDLEHIELIDLIEKIHDVEGIERIRLGSLEPRIITEDFVTRLVACYKVCPHFHLSLQSGCDETLKRMNRHYTTQEYKAAVDLLRKHYDHPALTTDVIVGFVGETPEEFEATRAYLTELNLYEMHIFKYSVREGTRAQKMSGHLPEQVKTERSAVLLEMTKKHKMAYEKGYIGKEENVLLEEVVVIDGQAYFQGYTKNYVKVAVKMEDTLKANELVDIVIEGILDENLLLARQIDKIG